MSDKSTTQKRSQEAQIQIRTTTDVKEKLEAGAELAAQELQRSAPGAKLGLGPWLVGLGLREIERMREERTPPKRAR